MSSLKVDQPPHIYEVNYQAYPALKEYKCLRCGEYIKENLRYTYVPDFFKKVEAFIMHHSKCEKKAP